MYFVSCLMHFACMILVQFFFHVNSQICSYNQINAKYMKARKHTHTNEPLCFVRFVLFQLNFMLLPNVCVSLWNRVSANQCSNCERHTTNRSGKKKVSIPTVRLYKYAIHHVHQCKILQEISLLNSFSVCLFYLIYFPYFHRILVFVQSIWWRFSVSHWVPVLCEFIYRMAFIRNSPTCTYPNIIIIIISIIIIHAQTYLLYIQIDCKCLHIWGVCGVYVRHQSCNFQAICSIYTYMYVFFL